MSKPKAIVRVEIEGAKELIAKISDPRLANVPMTELLTEAATLGQKAAVNAISGGTGIAEQSIGKKIDAQAMKARVYTMIAKARAMSIEKGRSPGEQTSFLEIAKWYKGSARKPTVTREEGYVVRAIQAAIRAGGAKGKGYIVTTRETVEREMPRLEKDALTKLEELAKS